MNDQQNTSNVLTKIDPEFQELVLLFEQEFEKVREKTPIKKVADNPILPNTKIIVTPNLFHIFRQRNELDFHPDIIKILKSLLPYTENKLEISFSLDFAQYGFRIGDLYNKIFEKIFPYYLFWNLKWGDLFLNMINDWRISFSRGDMPIEIIIPLKGFDLREESLISENEEITHHYNYDFYNKDHIKISLRSFSSYSILKFGELYQEEGKNFIFHGITKDIVKYGIFANNRIPFGINEHIEQIYSHNEIWDYIKQVIIAISLEGTLIRFGAPYYKFPWWFSNQIIQKFEFFHPDWMNRRYMDPNAYSRLIPDIQEEFKFEETRKIGGTLSTFFERDLETWISKPLNPTWELREDYFLNKGVNLSDPNKIIEIYNILFNKNSKVNFWNQAFILERFIHLSQRDKIEDVILDASSILEAIFIGGSETELSYRLKLNIAGLLAKDIDEFIRWYEYFKFFYKLRSSIIHGVNKAKQYSKFLKKCYGINQDQYDINDDLVMFRINKEIQYEIFQKLSMIIRTILERNIKIPDKFKEPGGFLEIFTSKLKDDI